MTRTFEDKEQAGPEDNSAAPEAQPTKTKTETVEETATKTKEETETVDNGNEEA